LQSISIENITENEERRLRLDDEVIEKFLDEYENGFTFE